MTFIFIHKTILSSPKELPNTSYVHAKKEISSLFMHFISLDDTQPYFKVQFTYSYKVKKKILHIFFFQYLCPIMLILQATYYLYL